MKEKYSIDDTGCEVSPLRKAAPLVLILATLFLTGVILIIRGLT